MKAKTLKNRKHLGLLKERYLQCFGVRANNVATLQGIVRNLIEGGISRRTLVAWAIEAGYTKGYVSSLLSRILVSLGLRERKKGGGRKPSPDALELLSHARGRYGERWFNVLRAAWRAGKGQHHAAAKTADEASAVEVMTDLASPFQKPGAYCGLSTITLGTRPIRAEPQQPATGARGKKRSFTLKITGT